MQLSSILSMLSSSRTTLGILIPMSLKSLPYFLPLFLCPAFHGISSALLSTVHCFSSVVSNLLCSPSIVLTASRSVVFICTRPVYSFSNLPALLFLSYIVDSHFNIFNHYKCIIWLRLANTSIIQVLMHLILLFYMFTRGSSLSGGFCNFRL